MTKEEAIIRSILGPSPNNIRAFSTAIRRTAHLLFVEGIPQDEILVTSDIYAQTAAELNKNQKSVTRQIERLANLCWNAMDKNQKMMYIGRNIKDIQAPKDMLFYLAYYCNFQVPYYKLMDGHIKQLSMEKNIPKNNLE